MGLMSAEEAEQVRQIQCRKDGVEKSRQLPDIMREACRLLEGERLLGRLSDEAQSWWRECKILDEAYGKTRAEQKWIDTERERHRQSALGKLTAVEMYELERGRIGGCPHNAAYDSARAKLSDLEFDALRGFYTIRRKQECVELDATA